MLAGSEATQTPTRPPGAQRALHSALRARIAACAIELPKLTPRALTLIDLAGKGRGTARQLASLVASEEGSCGQLIHVASSASLGFGSLPSSVAEAIERIGGEAALAVVADVGLRSQLLEIEGFEADARALWRHAVASGYFAWHIARLRERRLSLAFACGLLHDIGKPVLLRLAARLAREGELELTSAAGLHLAAELHARVGTLVAVSCGLPRPIVESIVYSSTSWGSPLYLDEVRTTSLAHEFASAALHPEAADAAELCSHPLVGLLGLGPRHVVSLLEQVPGVLQSLAASFSQPG